VVDVDDLDRHVDGCRPGRRVRWDVEHPRAVPRDAHAVRGGQHVDVVDREGGPCAGTRRDPPLVVDLVRAQ
jgi:hypothetical protein